MRNDGETPHGHETPHRLKLLLRTIHSSPTLTVSRPLKNSETVELTDNVQDEVRE